MSYIMNIPPTTPTPPGGNPGDIQYNAGGGGFGGETLVPLAHGGTNADLSGTGGTHFVLQQSTVGAAITVGQLSAAYLSDTATIGYVLRGNGTSFVSAQLAYSDLSGAPPLFATPMTTLGDIIYENVPPAATRLAGNITTTK